MKRRPGARGLGLVTQSNENVPDDESFGPQTECGLRLNGDSRR